MNSIISKIFVFVTEILSMIILFSGAIGVITVFLTSKDIWLGIAALLGLLFVTLLFGFSAMIVENHKLLQKIAANTKPSEFENGPQ
jgi:heme A synthase